MILRGIRVIELGGYASSSFCASILKDFGATVIKIEEGKSSDCCSMRNGKKSCAIQLGNHIGNDVFRNLCKSSDVLIEPFKKGGMEKHNLGPDVLLKDNPQLIYARLSNYGQEGCLSSLPGESINGLAISGVLSHINHINHQPVVESFLLELSAVGMLGALGIVAALIERKKSGLGQVVDANMVEGCAYLGSWLQRSKNLPVFGLPPGENILDGGAHYYHTYQTKDKKFMAAGALEPQFYNALIDGLSLTDAVSQSDDYIEARNALAKKMLEKNRGEWEEIFDGTDACCTPILTIEEAPKHKHNIERKSFKEVGPGKFVPIPAPILNRTPASCDDYQETELGNDTEEIMKILGYDGDSILRLEAEGVISLKKKSKL